MKSIESAAKSIDLAIENGLAQLGITREQAEIEILSSGGVFTKAKVRITQKETPGGRAKAFLEKMLAGMGVAGAVEMEEDAEKIRLNIAGDNVGAVIGYRGEVLDSLQYLTSLVVNKDAENNRNDPDFRRVVIDSENYREKREGTLVELASRMADKAVRTGRKVILDSMNPYERRIIHAALSENAEVSTHSEGEEPNRYLVIVPKNLKNDTRTSGGRGGYGNNRSSYGNNRGGRSSYNSDNSTGRPSKGENSPFRQSSGFSEDNTFFSQKKYK